MPNDGTDNSDLMALLPGLLKDLGYHTMEEYATTTKLRNICGLTQEKFSHQLITIALPQDYDMDRLRQKLVNLQYNRRTGAPTKWLIGAIMSVEWYSKTHPEGGNLHVHILKPGNYQKAKIVRDMASYFRVEPNFIDAKAGQYRDLYETRRKYIMGEKQEDKLEFSVLDKIWRSENNIMDVYEF